MHVFVLVSKVEGSAIEMPVEVVERLVHRAEDMTPNLDASLKTYRDRMLKIFEVSPCNLEAIETICYHLVECFRCRDNYLYWKQAANGNGRYFECVCPKICLLYNVCLSKIISSLLILARKETNPVELSWLMWT